MDMTQLAALAGGAPFSDPKFWLPLVFALLMALAILAYVVLDGYDLGVGILLRLASDEERDLMVASIGPFWDANETWLVLGVGLLLVAFPTAHGVILGALYLPVAFMLFGLILRGVAFDFRVKAQDRHKPLWNRLFWVGSLVASLAQGTMLGGLVTGFQPGWNYLGFSLFIGLCLCSGYVLLGAGWLIMKTEGELQRKAVYWARRAVWLVAAGVAAVSIVTPLVSDSILYKWFSMPWIVYLAPIPLATLACFVALEFSLKKLPRENDAGCWVPFALAVAVFLLAFGGLGYSLFPYLVIDKINIWEAASAPAALRFMLVGVAIVVPAIAVYTAFSYRVFWGKAGSLRYD